MTESLKPCPFCGGKAHYNRKQMPQGCVLVGYDCEQCGAAAPVFTGPEAIEKSMKIQAAEAWDRRAQQPNNKLTCEGCINANTAMCERCLRSDTCHIKYGFSDTYRRAIPENKPLTLEQLRKMDTMEVWVKGLENAHGIVNALEKRIDTVHFFYQFEDYGIMFTAYAHKPEGSEKG